MQEKFINTDYKSI